MGRPRIHASDAARKLAWQRANPRKIRDSNLRQRYNISLNEYEAMHLAQDGLCDCCGRPHVPHKKAPDLIVDHDHTTKAVRGLLCHQCNILIGMAEDSELRLRQAAAYLRKHHGKRVKGLPGRD